MVAHLACPANTSNCLPPTYLTSEIRGVVTALAPSDGIPRLHIRDFWDRDLIVRVSDTRIAEHLSAYVHDGMVSIRVEGFWLRTAEGWLPREAECEVRSFVRLKTNSTIADALDLLTSCAAEAWNQLDNPIAEWLEIRGATD